MKNIASVMIFVSNLMVAVSTAATEAKVHVFASGENGIFANAYLIETDKSVVAVDATLLESTSHALHEQLVAIGKPLRAVLLTHGHPDHYNGLTNLVAGSNAEIISTAGTDHVIREYDLAKEKQWAPVFGPEWPVHRTFPTKTIRDGETVEFDGVKFTVHELGAGESHSDSYWTMEAGREKAAFIGDVVLNRVHAYVTDGHTREWLNKRDRVEKALKHFSAIYPGHGESGDASLFAWQRSYLLEYRRAVKELAAGKPSLTDEQKQELTKRMTTFLPNQKLAFLIALGADSVASEMVKEATK